MNQVNTRVNSILGETDQVDGEIEKKRKTKRKRYTSNEKTTGEKVIQSLSHLTSKKCLPGTQCNLNKPTC